MQKRLPAFTLTELMLVLVIIGILVLLALPNLTGLFGQAYSVEAKKQLKYLATLQETYYQQNFKYTTNLIDLRFEQPKLKRDGGDGIYIYEIANASKNAFLARATASEDFDRDGIFNVWEIDQNGGLRETTLD